MLNFLGWKIFAFNISNDTIFLREYDKIEIINEPVPSYHTICDRTYIILSNHGFDGDIIIEYQLDITRIVRAKYMVVIMEDEWLLTGVERGMGISSNASQSVDISSKVFSRETTAFFAPWFWWSYSEKNLSLQQIWKHNHNPWKILASKKDVFLKLSAL